MLYEIYLDHERNTHPAATKIADLIRHLVRNDPRSIFLNKQDSAIVLASRLLKTPIQFHGLSSKFESSAGLQFTPAAKE